MTTDFIFSINILMSVIAVIIGLLVFLRSSREGYSWWFMLIALAGAGWLVSSSVANTAVDLSSADIASKSAYLFGFLSMLFGLIFSFNFPVKQKISSVSVVLIMLFGLGGIALSVSPSITGQAYHLTQSGAIDFLLPRGIILYIILFSLTVTWLFWSLRKSYQTFKEHRANTALIAIAFGAGGAAGLLIGVVFPAIFGEWKITLFSSLPILIAVGIIAYAIVRYRLFDIRLATARSLAYVLTLSILSSAYYVIAYVISIAIFQGSIESSVFSISPLNILLALVLAFIFQPIKHFFDQFTDRIFYRGEYDRDTFFREFGQILSYDTNLKLLLRRASSYITENLKAERAYFQIANRGVFGGAANDQVSEIELSRIVKYYKENVNQSPVVFAGLVQSDEVRSIMGRNNIRIALPLMSKNHLIGCLFLGEHKSRGYSARDIGVIESVTNELTIAISNSLSVEEIRDLNASLQQRVNEATKELTLTNKQLRKLDETKDEFISMASHQLRTPLTSIKGYLDMVLQGDLGKINATQRAALSDAYLSSERMVSLINDFLNISRLQTGKFIIDRRSSDVSSALYQELQMLGFLAKQHGLELSLNVDKDIPPLLLDIDKLRQVIVNMIDNAIYYSKPNTAIEIRLGIENGELIFSVQDTGIGVPKSEQDQLFSKFFRATNARKRRPDGTGVGLFLSKKVILAHGGQIIFKSTEGEGSIFGFRIPVSEG